MPPGGSADRGHAVFEARPAEDVRANSYGRYRGRGSFSTIAESCPGAIAMRDFNADRYDDIDRMIDDFIDDFIDDIDGYSDIESADDVEVNRPGDCTWPRYFQLRQMVVRHCKHGLTTRCDQNTSCHVVNGRLLSNQRCQAARANLNRECFRGGDPGHIRAENDYRLAVGNCTERLLACRRQRGASGRRRVERWRRGR
jgi:hypothetical protein